MFRSTFTAVIMLGAATVAAAQATGHRVQVNGLAPRHFSGDLAHRRHHPGGPAPPDHRAVPQRRDSQELLRRQLAR